MTGLIRNDKHQYRWQDGPWLPGVTSIISKVDKSGPLIGWAKGVTADAALSNLSELAEMSTTKGHAVAKAWLTAHATAESDSAKDIGTRIHLAAEQVARGAEPEIAPEHMPWLAAYQRFIEDYAPEFLSLERFACNLSAGYAGTYDFIANINGEKVIGDLKTGKGVYSETRLQLTALARCEFIGMPNDEKQYPMPHFDAAVILHVRPDAYAKGYQLYRFTPSEADWQAFLGALAIYTWDQQRPSRGEPMTPMTLEAIA